MSGSGMIASQRAIAPADYPWAGTPRRFSALAMPAGDPRFGVEGPLVQVQTFRGGGDPKLQLLSRDEAEQLVAELRGALRTFDLAARMAEGTEPRACTAPYPFRGQGTLAECEG